MTRRGEDRLHVVSLVIIVLIAAAININWSTAKDPLTVYVTDIGEQHISAGGHLTLYRHVCSTSNLHIDVERTFKSKEYGTITKAETGMYDITPTCGDVEFIVPTPVTLIPGYYIYTPTMHYDVNPLIHIEKDAPPQKFKVINLEDEQL